MKLKKAINQLKDLQLDRAGFIVANEEDSIFTQDYEAIKTVLTELERLRSLKQKNLECTSNTQMVKIPLDEYVRLQWEAGFSAGMLQILEQK